MSFLGTVNWNEIEDIGFKPLSAGNYGAKITKAELSNNKAGTGKYIKLELTLLGGKGIKGRRVFDYLTVQHSNPQVVQIALGKLKKLIKASGQDPDSVQDTSELIGSMVSVGLKIQNDEKYGPQNKIVDFSEFNEELLEKTADGDNSSY